MRHSRQTLFWLCFVIAGTALWVVWLRWPTFAHPVWNLDEGIYATVGRVILDGGVMYRDAIDHRTPLAHYFAAGVYGVAGINNQWAIHFATALLIGLAGAAVGFVAHRLAGRAAAVAAALAFSACCCAVLYPGDAHAYHTEWLVTVFTSLGAWWFWRTADSHSFARHAITGALYAGAFLSKQPGLLDFGAPVLTVLGAAYWGAARWIDGLRRVGAMATGFTATLALALGYFHLRGALDDLYLYGWVYNLVYYTPETNLGDRAQAAWALALILWDGSPWLLAFLAAGLLAQLKVLQHPDATGSEKQRHALFTLSWFFLSLAGAASAGRVYGHYYIQVFPALALLVGGTVARVVERLRARPTHGQRIGAILALLIAAWAVIAVPVRARGRSGLGPESFYPSAEYIRAHSRPSDRIFVWGMHPDYYLLADRAPASRFIYCSLVTGLIPWVNIAPELDTAYARLPGALETLLRDLQERRPTFFVDTSAGPSRQFQKYPLRLFPRLERFVAENYVEIEPARFRAQGVRVLRLKAGPAAAPSPGDGSLAAPLIIGLTQLNEPRAEFDVYARDARGQLARIDLLVDGKAAGAVATEPVHELSARFLAPLDAGGPGPRRITAFATDTAGRVRWSSDHTVVYEPGQATPQQLERFALPVRNRGVAAHSLYAPHGFYAAIENSSAVFYVHAPSTLAYPLRADGARITGRFGFKPGAYEASNAGATDGAEFRIVWIDPRGRRTVLFQRLLRPREAPVDRGEQPLDCRLPATGEAGTLEFSVTPGPAGNAASDWTYWSDLTLNPGP